MADCIYCGKSAGWFKSFHQECRNAADSKLESSPFPVGAERRMITYRDELLIAKKRQRVWIKYEDAGGGESSRKIEIYNAQDDDFIFAWCCLKNEPRTFRRDRIKAWKVLDETFEFNPLVQRWWEEEGSMGRDKMPWNRWIESVDDIEYDELKNTEEEEEDDDPPPVELSQSEKENLMTGWNLMEKAISCLPDPNSKLISDYAESIRLFSLSLERDLSAYSKADIHRRVGEIYLQCDDKKNAIIHFQNALKWNPKVGVRKLLGKLLSENEEPKT